MEYNDSKPAPFSRRRALTLLGGAGTVAFVSAVLPGCGEKALTCTDTTGLTPQQVAQRKGLQYVDKSTVADKNCTNCQFYQAASDPKSCGGCQIMPGVVHPDGYCSSWAEKQS